MGSDDFRLELVDSRFSGVEGCLGRLNDFGQLGRLGLQRGDRDELLLEGDFLFPPANVLLRLAHRLSRRVESGLRHGHRIDGLPPSRFED